MSRRQELAARRRLLEARCELQRQELAVSVGGVTQSLRPVDTAVRVARRAAAHPLLLAAVVVLAVVVIRPRRLLQGLNLGLSAGLAARRASTLLRSGT
jgi:hypothetical protein